jgi:hemerythrin superfamily protein
VQPQLLNLDPRFDLTRRRFDEIKIEKLNEKLSKKTQHDHFGSSPKISKFLTGHNKSNTGFGFRRPKSTKKPRTSHLCAREISKNETNQYILKFFNNSWKNLHGMQI